MPRNFRPHATVISKFGETPIKQNIFFLSANFGQCRTKVDDLPCIFPFTYSDGKYPDGSARPWVSHYQCTKRDLKLASGWGSAFWCATKVNADGYYEEYDWCNDDCPNPETNINYAYESSQIYWTYEKESKTIRNQKCKYVHT